MRAPRRPPPHRPRRALSAPGGPVTATGDAGERARLAEALAAGTRPGDDEALARQLTHGFHSYPARFHPLLARRLLDDVRPAQVVLDPFVGSGTSLIEALLRGAYGRGVDVNPLAIELTRLKASVWPDGALARLVAAAQAASERSLKRVKARARTRESGERYDDPRHYAPHVFRELVGLREELEAEPDEALRRPLLLVLSSMVVKVSRQPADTAAGTVERAIGKGMPSRLLLRKTEELARNLGALAGRVPEGTPRPDVRPGDARTLAHVGDASVDVIVTSPPYLGTYDYAEQHLRRFGWLGLDAERFSAREIGARRKAQDPAQALAAWQEDVDAFVAEMARVLKAGGRAYVVIGDSAVRDQVIAGDEAVRQAAARAGLEVPASAAQSRPSFYRGVAARSRREHLLLLRRR